jgi:transketolase
VRAAALLQGNVAVAMGRSKLPIILDDEGEPLFGGDYEFAAGEIVWAREGADGVVLTMGTLAGAAVAASDALREEGFDLEVGIVATPLELDDAAMRYVAEAPLVITVEDHSVRTGLGASVADWLARNAGEARLVTLGVESYQSSGASAELFARVGLDAPGIAERIKRELRRD